MLSMGKYVRAASVEEAYELVQQNRRACVLGGGAWLRLGTGTIPVAIDLADCALDTVEPIDDDPVFGRALGIGAYVTLRQLERSAELAAATDGLLARAVRDIVGVQFRNVATVGGSVAGRFGFSDVCCALLALGAHAELVGAGRLPMEDFLARQGRLRDVLTRVIVPAGPVRASYQAVRNQSTDFPVASACAVYAQGSGWRVAVGARPGRARLAATPLSAEPAPAELEALADAARALPFSGNMWASERYRRHVAGVLACRAVEDAAGPVRTDALGPSAEARAAARTERGEAQ